MLVLKTKRAGGTNSIRVERFLETLQKNQKIQTLYEGKKVFEKKKSVLALTLAAMTALLNFKR